MTKPRLSSGLLGALSLALVAGCGEPSEEPSDAVTIGFAVLALGVRTAVLIPVLRLGGVDPRSGRLIAWIGPRGLSTLLLALLLGPPGVCRALRQAQVQAQGL